MADLTDAGLRQRVEQRLQAIAKTIAECAKDAEPDEPVPCHLCVEREADATVIRDLLAAVDQIQPGAELQEQLEFQRKRADDRVAINTRLSAEKERLECDILDLRERAEAAEARLQALQPYVQHKSNCDLVVGVGFEDNPLGCTCGLATLTQPGAAGQESGVSSQPAQSPNEE